MAAADANSAAATRRDLMESSSYDAEIFGYSMRRKGRALMRNTVLKAVAVAVALSPAIGLAQSKPTSATYITDEEVKAVNATPGIDRSFRIDAVGPENYAVGVIHRGASNAAGRGAGT